MNRGSEVAQRRIRWLREIEEGAEDMRSSIDAPNIIELEIVTDCRDLYDTVPCKRPYAGSDQSVTMYVESIKHDILSV